MKEEILEAKRKLYFLLLSIDDVDKLSETEIDIMYLLSKDEQIQLLFKNNPKN